MGQLLNSAIKMQGSVAALPPTIEINNLGGVFVTWAKNGIGQGSVITTITATLVNGDTVIVSASNPFDEGATIDYYLNTTYIASYSDISLAQTPSITCSSGNAYKFDCFAGF
jgi:hypothetical protein